ncbi:unnamed protein product [Rotaria socialis]|uniref:Uncharacterized protein n=1 Tax=Rotaria socialis TaxID=392032 RepID=A0A821AMM9_9BILA|nr:unnamed protein product [Rotaria socialis]
MTHTLIRSFSQIFLKCNIINEKYDFNIKSSTRNGKSSLFYKNDLKQLEHLFISLRNFWFYKDIEIHFTSCALTSVSITDDDDSGRDILFSSQNRLEKAQLLTIMFDEDACSLFINFYLSSFSENSIVTLPELISGVRSKMICFLLYLVFLMLLLMYQCFTEEQTNSLKSVAKCIITIMLHVRSKTPDTAYIGRTTLIVDARKGKVAVRSTNVLPALLKVKTQQRNKENLLCYPYSIKC